jgi:hypothetical protein
MLYRIFLLYIALSTYFSCSDVKLGKEDSRRISSILDASRRFYKVLCHRNMSHYSSASPGQLAVLYAQVFLVWKMKRPQLGENTMYGLFGAAWSPCQGGIKARKEIFVGAFHVRREPSLSVGSKRAAGVSFSISIVCVFSYPITPHHI